MAAEGWVKWPIKEVLGGAPIPTPTYATFHHLEVITRHPVLGTMKGSLGLG